MDWPLRTEKASATVPAPVNPPVRETLERVSPAVAALFEPVHADGSHAVLDLGPASPSSFNVYGRFARWIRFAEALSLPLPIYDSADPFRVVPENPQQPYDLVLAWNVFDVVPPEARRLLVERLLPKLVRSADYPAHAAVLRPTILRSARRPEFRSLCIASSGNAMNSGLCLIVAAMAARDGSDDQRARAPPTWPRPRRSSLTSARVTQGWPRAR
jgi:hypothetical protein